MSWFDKLFGRNPDVIISGIEMVRLIAAQLDYFHAGILDKRYKLVESKAWFVRNCPDPREYIEDFADCDDRTIAVIASFHGYAVGEVLVQGHSLNIVITADKVVRFFDGGKMSFVPVADYQIRNMRL